MTHKAFETFGEKVFLDRIMHDAELNIIREDINRGLRSDYLREILKKERERKEGIFQRSMVIGRLDFIEPLYPPVDEFLDSSLEIEKKINPINPTLNVYYEIDPKNLFYSGKTDDNIPIFETDVYKINASFVTDAISEFKNYVDGLIKAGFKIE